MKLNKCQKISTLLVLTLLTALLAKKFDIVFAQTANCTNKVQLLTVDNHPVWKWNGLNVVFYKSGMTIDADGAPNAYHPDNIGLDDLKNAGYPNTSWWKNILVPDPQNPNRAYEQREHLIYASE